MTSTRVERADPASEPALALLQAMSNEMEALYDVAGAGPTVPAAVLEKGGAFVLAWSGAEAVGCGAIHLVEADLGEVKRMYVAPAARGRGVGGAILGALEDLARDIGYARLRLETGARQTAAMRLYERAGYRRTECYGSYATDPLSVCYEKVLSS
jgi:GNAT superfamily N-acetyltransferase